MLLLRWLSTDGEMNEAGSRPVAVADKPHTTSSSNATLPVTTPRSSQHQRTARR